MLGKKYAIGIAKEGTRGTGEASPDVWIPMVEPAFINPMKEYIQNESNYGVIVDSVDAVIDKEWAELEIPKYIAGDKTIGYFLLGALGQVSSEIKETTAYEHTFSLLGNSDKHQSFTLEMKNDLEQLKHALGMFKSVKLSGAKGQYLEVSASLSAKKGTSSSNTPSYAQENNFFSKMITFKHASNLAGLSGASNSEIASFELSLDKDVEELFVLGSTEPTEIVNKTFSVELNLEGYFDATTLKDLYEAGTEQAVEIDILSPVTIGASSNPRITIKLAKCHIEEWSPSGGMGDQIKQTMRLKGKYSISESSIGSVVVVNEQESY
jgi:hypothetical protein